MAWTQFDSDYQSFQHASATARTAGDVELLGDTVVAVLADTPADELATLIYQCEQVTVPKEAAALAAGELLRVVTAATNNGQVNDNATGSTNKACGFGLEAAIAAATTMKIKFDGRPRGA